MLLDCWLYVKPINWELLDSGSKWTHKLFSRYSYSNAITGLWKTYQSQYEVYNLLLSELELESLQLILGTELIHSFAWVQGKGYDNLDLGQTIPSEVLAVMPDHIIYDSNGNPIESIPATIVNPNWQHVFVDQKKRIFAGDFNNDFGEDFL